MSWLSGGVQIYMGTGLVLRYDDSEMINVGGETVYPAEVERVLQQTDGVEDVSVTGEPNPITGQIVVARVQLATAGSPADFRRRMQAYRAGRLPRYKTPRRGMPRYLPRENPQPVVSRR